MRPALLGLGGTRGHQGRSLPVTSSTGPGFATPRLFGDPQEAAAPLPPHGARRDPPASGSEPRVSFGAILHYQTSLALSIGNFYNSLLGWKR